MLNGSELDLPRVRGVLTEWEPSGPGLLRPFPETWWSTCLCSKYDPGCWNSYPVLLLSEEGKRVSWQERCQDLPSSPQRFTSIPCVLGQLHIISGRYSWEVEVGNACSWDLGVCRDNVTRKGRVTVSPKNGFWAIRFYEGEYWALTSPETHLILREKPFIVRVFLDYEAGDVSFYNMTDGSHIFTFPQNTFYGILRPLFRIWSSESGSLTICPGEGECADVVIQMSTTFHEKWLLWSPMKITILPQWDTNKYFSYSLLVHSHDEALDADWWLPHINSPFFFSYRSLLLHFPMTASYKY